MGVLEQEARLMADMQPPNPDWLHAVLGLKSHHVIAGAVGGMARGLVAKGISWPQRLTSAIVGAMVAGYGTPIATPVMQSTVETIHGWLGIAVSPVQNMEGSTGFALGLVGMSLCDVAIRWTKRWLEGNMPGPGKKE